MEGADASVSSLYTELIKCGQNLEWEKGIKFCNKIMHVRPDDFKALHCKIVCLIQLSEFERAIDTIHRSSKIAKGIEFEHAYCLYRLNRIPQALKVLETAPEVSHRIDELKAQILYRLEHYDDCFELYRSLIKNSQDDYDSERSTNFSAVLAFCKPTNMSQDEMLKAAQGHTYELAYNKGCVLIAQEKYAEAELALLEAEELCKKSFDDDEDVVEDDIDAELEIIRIQLGYCKQMLKKKYEASQLYTLVMKRKPSDIALLAIVSNNVVVVNKDRNVFESKKRMKSTTATGLEQKLTKNQQKTLSINQCLFSLNINQNDQCRDQLKTLRSQYPDCRDIALIEAALLCREKNLDEAIKLLKSDTNLDNPEMPRKAFALIQLLLTQGHFKDACNVLASLDRISYKPGVVSALLTFYTYLGNPAAATRALEDAIAWYKVSNPSSPNFINLLKESANFNLAHRNFVIAAKSLEELIRLSPNDPKITAKLVAAYSKFDQEKAKLLSNSLPTVEEVSKSVEIDNLENLSWSLGSKQFKKMGKVEDSPGKTPGSNKAVDELLLKKRKKKKNKKPKGNLDPDAFVDPERWLPRRERSNYKKRKDRRGVGIGKGTQGATTVSSELDGSSKFSSAAETPRSTTATSNASSPQQDSRPQRSSQQSKKKKKKGGKW